MSVLMNHYDLSFKEAVDLLILTMVFSGVFGFVYEELFYRIDLGYFVKRGSTFGPWIPIYFFGGAMFALLATRMRANPLLVFVLCTVSSGILEYAVGSILYNVFHTRLWDYNTEIWNWGNINGYICARSVLFFGISGVSRPGSQALVSIPAEASSSPSARAVRQTAPAVRRERISTRLVPHSA